MTDIEQKALALVNELLRLKISVFSRSQSRIHEALCRAIEQHEAFRQEVSDAVEQYWASLSGAFVAKPPPYMARFIISKPDLLVEAMHDCGVDRFESWADQLRAAIEKRGGKIVWGEG